MEKTSLDAINKTYFLLSIITLTIGLFPNIETFWKIVLFITSTALLIIVYFSIYISAIDKIENEITDLKNKIEANEKVLNTIKDIILIKSLNKR